MQHTPMVVADALGCHNNRKTGGFHCHDGSSSNRGASSIHETFIMLHLPGIFLIPGLQFYMITIIPRKTIYLTEGLSK